MRCAALALLCCSWPAAAGAQVPSTIRVTVAVEDGLDGQEVVGLLRLELATDGVESILETPREGASPAARLRIASRPNGVSVRLVRTATERHVSRELELGDTPRGARERVVALGAAELVRRGWSELLRQPTSAPLPPELAPHVASRLARPTDPRAAPAEPPPDTVDTTEPTPQPTDPSRSFGFGLDGGLRGGLRAPYVALDLSLVAEIPLAASPGVRLTVSGDFGGWPFDVGSMLGLAVAGGAVGAQLVVADPEMFLAPGARLSAGYARVDVAPGVTVTPNELAGGYVSLSATLEGGLHVGGPIWLVAGVEVGGAFVSPELVVDGVDAGLGPLVLGAWVGPRLLVDWFNHL